MSRMKIVEVDWIDSCASLGWSNAERATPLHMACKSIGFLLCEDKETMTISAHLSGDKKNAHSPLTIPKVAITKRKVIGSRP